MHPEIREYVILDDCANLILQITKRYGKDCYLQMELNMQNRHRKHRQSRHFCLWTISMKAEMKDAEVFRRDQDGTNDCKEKNYSG